jgi:hypothetical protein
MGKRLCATCAIACTLTLNPQLRIALRVKVRSLTITEGTDPRSLSSSHYSAKELAVASLLRRAASHIAGRNPLALGGVMTCIA